MDRVIPMKNKPLLPHWWTSEGSQGLSSPQHLTISEKALLVDTRNCFGQIDLEHGRRPHAGHHGLAV